MQVILLQDVEKLGSLGDIVDVANGYARNYLLPKRLACLVNAGRLQEVQLKKKKEETKRAKEIKDLRLLAKQLSGLEITLTAKTTEEGRLFGSITQALIAQELSTKGYSVEESAIAMEEHIKECGTYDILLNFGHGVTASIKLSVVKEE